MGVYFGSPGVEADDPYFGGVGPSRTGCISCGNCNIGCGHNAKNKLTTNYLYLAEKLGVDYVDLYLVHWPGGGATRAWPGMEAARARSYARTIGVSNFDAGELDQVIAGASVAPVVDQVQFNPSAYRKALLDACAERGVALEAYSPLGTGAQLGDPVVVAIADRRGRSPAQVLLRWCVQRGIPVITKSTRRDRIAENAQVFDFELSAADMEELDALDRSGGTKAALERKWW